MEYGQYCSKCGRTVPYTGIGGLCDRCAFEEMEKYRKEQKRVDESVKNRCSFCGELYGKHTWNCLNKK